MNSHADEEEAIEEIEFCAVCREGAEILCTGCFGAPDYDGCPMLPVYYCSTGCQDKDWDEFHGHACEAAKNRRAVYRLGEIAQLAFQAYLKRLYDICIIKVEKQGDTLFLHQGKNDENTVMPFPGSRFEDEDQIATLTAMTCGNALGFVHMLVEKTLGVLKTARVDCTPKDCRRRVVHVTPTGEKIDNTAQSHAILQVTFNNEQFALDVTGTQYGHAEPVIPWHIYAKSRIEAIVSVKRLQSIEECKRQIDENKNGIKAIKTREEEFAEVFGRAVDQWVKENGSVFDMLRSKEDIYKTRKTMLLAFIDERVKKHKAHMKSNGRLKCEAK